MAEVALTGISVGRMVDNKFERVEVKAGESLPTWVPKSDKDALRQNGALGEPVPTQEELDNKDAQIAELKAQLAAAQAQDKVEGQGSTDSDAGKDK